MNKALLRVLTILLVAVMTMSFIVGCSPTPAAPTSSPQQAKTEAPTSVPEPTVAKLEPIDFTIWSGAPDPGTFVDEDECHKYIREKLGVNIKTQYTPSDPDTQLTLMLAGGDYPDAIGKKPGPIMDDYVKGGHLLELTGWLQKYSPQLYDYMMAAPDAYDFDIEGFHDKFYWLPGQLGYSEEFPCIEPTFGFRMDIWKKLADDPAKLPKPKDLEEMFQMMKAMVAAQPEYEGKKTYAISGWFADGWGATWSVYSLQRFGGSRSWLGSATQADNWKREYCFDSQEWMYAMRWLNRAYREGIADPEAVTMNQEAYNNKLAQGIVFCNYYAGVWLDGVANTARAAAGFPEQKIVPYTWMKYPASSGITAEPITGQFMPFGLTALYFTKNCANAEEIIKRLSWLGTEEGIAFQGVGVEGVHWNYDPQGIRKPTDEIINMKKNDPDFIEKTGIGKYGIFSNYYGGYDSKGDAYILTENKYYLAATEDKYDIEYKQLLGLDAGLTVEANAARAGKTVDCDGVAWPVDLKIETGSPMADLQTQLENWQAEYIGKLYTAKSDQEFDALIAEWKTKATNQKYMDYYNHINPLLEKGYQDYLAKK